MKINHIASNCLGMEGIKDFFIRYFNGVSTYFVKFLEIFDLLRMVYLSARRATDEKNRFSEGLDNC